jgi:hypothetical protein
MCTQVDKCRIYVGFTFLFQNEEVGVSIAPPKQCGPKTVSQEDTNSLMF